MGRAARASRARAAPRPSDWRAALACVALWSAAPARGQPSAPEDVLEAAAPPATRTATLTPAGTSSASAQPSTLTPDVTALDEPPLSPEELALIEALTAPPTPAVVVRRTVHAGRRAARARGARGGRR
jgi:hypothetical protein